MNSSLQFHDTPPMPIGTKTRLTRWSGVRAQLMTAPGKWAVILETTDLYKAKTAATAMRNYPSKEFRGARRTREDGVIEVWASYQPKAQP